MESDSNADIKRLRTEARRLGIAILKQPVSRASPSLAYRLIERDTGRVIYRNVALEDIRLRLWMLRYRQPAPIDPVPAQSRPIEHCPSCGTVRNASFRWCASCGFGYEAGTSPPLDPGATVSPAMSPPLDPRAAVSPAMLPPLDPRAAVSPAMLPPLDPRAAVSLAMLPPLDPRATVSPATAPSLDPAAAVSPATARTGGWLVPAIYLVGIAAAEVAARGSAPWLGVLLYAVILVAALNQAAASRRPLRALLLTIALVAVERLLGFTEPLATLGRSYAFVAVAVPTLVGIVVVARLARYSRRDLGLMVDRRVAGISLVLTLPSVALGFGLSGIVQPVALHGEAAIAGIVITSSVLVLTTGLVEEMLFRGLLQRAATDCLGPAPGVLYVAGLYTLLASGPWNAVGIALVLCIALVLALVTTYTRSVVPAAAAHASLNIGVLLAAASVGGGIGLR